MGINAKASLIVVLLTFACYGASCNKRVSVQDDPETGQSRIVLDLPQPETNEPNPWLNAASIAAAVFLGGNATKRIPYQAIWNKIF